MKRGDRGAGPADWGKALRDVGPYLGIGTGLAGTVLLGVGIGYWLDRRFGTSPLWLILGGVLGIVVAGYHFWKSFGKLER